MQEQRASEGPRWKNVPIPTPVWTKVANARLSLASDGEVPSVASCVLEAVEEWLKEQEVNHK